MHRDIYQGQISSKTTTVGWVWPDMPSHAQTCVNFSGGDFGSSRGGMTTSKTVKSESFKETNLPFPHVLRNVEAID